MALDLLDSRFPGYDILALGRRTAGASFGSNVPLLKGCPEIPFLARWTTHRRPPDLPKPP